MITLSTSAMKRDLRVLWAKSFPDPQAVINFFFQYRYRADQCLALVRENRVISALHLLPAQIVTENGRSPVQYIYAAATLPEYRNTGCMTQLLKAAEDLGTSRGIPFTALVPSVQSLFPYYERSGFVPYFETRTVRVSKEELKKLAHGGREKRAQASSRLLASVRTEALGGGVGNLLWDCSAFSFASAYQKAAQGNVFSAATPGYVGYEEGGQLTEKVRRKPYSVVLFDEIEKAHEDVWNILLQILEDGVVTDSQGRKVDFRNTAVIMTSNVGAKSITAAGTPLGFAPQARESADARFAAVKSAVTAELRRTFRPEFLNRVDETIVFRQLQKEDSAEIARRLLAQTCSRAAALGITLEIREECAASLAERGCDAVYGARPLRRLISTEVEDALATCLLDGTLASGDTAVLRAGETALHLSKKEETALAAFGAHENEAEV